MENATQICNEVGGYLHCDKCPLFAACNSDYTSTEEFEETMEKAATEYLKGKENNE